MNCSVRGQCVDAVNSFACECSPGYSGTVCEKEGERDWKRLYAHNVKAENRRVSILGGILCTSQKHSDENYDFIR